MERILVPAPPFHEQFVNDLRGFLRHGPRSDPKKLPKDIPYPYRMPVNFLRLIIFVDLSNAHFRITY